MTNEEYLAKKLPNYDDDDIAFLISSATAIYKSITHFDEVKPEHENWILRACLEISERENFTGAKDYNENGIAATYDRTQLSYGLISELPNTAVMYKKDGEQI